ncbi:MAG: divalent-cation tolerance protein CutA [Gammaproteobacteria bacterium]|jgi:periplasmic divalent cation tolerance protein|nr:divalent-cation tolerance protein CutA [Gammaproteobacteria bacterium]
MDFEHFRLVLNTCPDERTARELGRGLVEAGLAACVNLVPGLISIYRWEGALQEGGEWLLLIKTTAGRLEEIQAWISERHPYSLAEIIAIPLAGGLPAYLDWIAQGTAVAPGPDSASGARS